MGIPDYRIYGSGKSVIYILHGIFGMKDNWHYVAGKLQEKYTVVTLDARNHGKSFHDHAMSYALMAEDILGLMSHLGHIQIHLIGHSMGGKTAMTFAAMFPEKLLSLAVVDIAMRAYKPGHLPYFKAFEEIDFLQIQSRTEADQAFMPYAPEATVRQFLLKNLEPLPGGGYRPKFNLPAIEKFYSESIGELHIPANVYSGPTAFIYGQNSHYVQVNDHAPILASFPSAKFIAIPNAGHWVHADNPEAFLTVIQQFIPD